MSPQPTESVDFNGVGFILIESTVFEIFVFYIHTLVLGFCILPY